MAYLLPHEDLFVAGVGLLILVLLVLRVVIRKRQQAQTVVENFTPGTSLPTDHRPKG